MITADAVTEHLKETSRDHAIPMWEAMCERAETDAEYGKIFYKWLEEGGTVILRDDLCLQFKDQNHLFQEHPVHRYPWDDAWMAIDTTRYHLRLDEEASPPSP